MVEKSTSIAAALRMQALAKAARAAREARMDPELRKPFSQRESDRLSIAESWDQSNEVCSNRHLDTYATVAAIWLDTPKRPRPAVSTYSDIAERLDRFKASLDLYKPNGKRGKS